MYTIEQINNLKPGDRVGLVWSRRSYSALGTVTRLTRTQVVVDRDEAKRTYRFMRGSGNCVGGWEVGLSTVEDANAAIAERTRRDAVFTMVAQLEQIRWSKESFAFLRAVSNAVAVARHNEKRGVRADAGVRTDILDGEKPVYNIEDNPPSHAEFMAGPKPNGDRN